ncbi:hypothetical protein BH11PSE13_BH11PSE13_15800 [soil metagenome]
MTAMTFDRLHRTPGTHRRERGISLIEMMVGILIGLVCVLVILQLLSSWEGRKRTTTSGSDAQTSGTLAAFTLDRDLRLAGYGFGLAGSDVMGCNVPATNTTVGPLNFLLRPVEIEQGATADKPDIIRVLYGNSPYFVASQPMLSSTPTAKTLKSRDGFQKGDVMLVTGNTPVDCRFVEITDQDIADAVTLKHEATSYTTFAGVLKNAEWNTAAGTLTTFSTGRVFNLGPAPVRSIWTVNPTTQTLTRYNSFREAPDKAVDIAADVVTLKAQYGIDANDNGIIESSEWKDPDPTLVIADWTKVRAIRFGILVRSRQYERAELNSGVAVTPASPTWAEGSQSFTMKNLDGSNDSGGGAITGPDAPNNWRNYRYRVYENVVPLRNMIWGTAP